MKDLIAKLTMDANCAMGAIWLHIEAREARIAELEEENARLSASWRGDATVADALEERVLELEAENEELRASAQVVAEPVAQDANELRKAIRDVEISTSGSKGYAKAWNEGAEHMREAILDLVASTALQAPVREVPEWQPIETAPKDGTRFLAVYDGKVDFYHWQEMRDFPTAPVGWRNSFITVYPENEGPEVWMPIPDADVRDGWIDCRDELPEIGREVIVFTPRKDRKVTALARLIQYEGATNFHWDNSYPGKGNMHLPESVTHWMPLPAAPVQQEGEKP